MKKAVLSIAVLSGPFLLMGCSINGKWSLASVEPSAARRDVQYHTLTLEKDGSFYGEADEPGIVMTTGTYTYKDGVLTLVEHGGVLHTYDARPESGGRLVLIECSDKDGAHHAKTEATGIRTTSGTYTFKDGVLALVEHDGERHAYDARLQNGGKRLHIERVWKEGRKMKAEYERKE